MVYNKNKKRSSTIYKKVMDKEINKYRKINNKHKKIGSATVYNKEDYINKIGRQQYSIPSPDKKLTNLNLDPDLAKMDKKIEEYILHKGKSDEKYLNILEQDIKKIIDLFNDAYLSKDSKEFYEKNKRDVDAYKTILSVLDDMKEDEKFSDNELKNVLLAESNISAAQALLSKEIKKGLRKNK